MLNTSKPSSSSKGDEASKPVKKRQKSSKTSAKETGSKSTDRCEPLATSSARNEVNAEGERWYELLKEKIGFDINAKRWMEEHPELASQNKSELLIRLACEVCLAKNTEYDPKNENEEQNNKYIRFDTQRIFALFEVANPLIEQSDRKNFVEFICQKGNVQLLEMICKQESKDLKEGCRVERQYKWQGTFTGYSKLIDLLQYVIDNRYSPEIVLCLAEKFYGYAHIFWNGKQYLDSFRFQQMKGRFNYQDSVVKELLKQAIKLGYKGTVLVMLSGDIYHSIRLMEWKIFKEKPEFLAAYNMIKETVADVINSSVEDCKDYVLNLLDQGIKGDLHKMSKEDLIHQLEYLGKEVRDKAKISKKKLVKTLEELGEKKGEVILRSTIVGALISTLFFKYQDKVMKGEPFTLKVTKGEKSRKGKILDELNEKIKIGNGKSIEDIVLELIRQLHLGNHIKSHWFFREVLVKVVSENLDKLKAVCAAICKEPIEKLLRGEEVHENVTGVLQFFGVEVLPVQIVRSEIPSSAASIADQFMKDINVYSEKAAKEDCSSDEMAFSGLTRKIIRDFEEKQDLTDEEKKALISKVLSEIKRGINILDDKTAVKIDIKDIFLSFELINSKIEKERKREIVEFICQKGNVQLLGMICKQENSKKMIEIQYKWQGTFTGYSKLIDLLQYVIDNRCSQEIVLCIAKKIYGYAHIFYNGEQYLEPVVVANMKRNFNYQDSDIKDLLKQVIKLGYKDAVSVMLAGDIYHSIRLIKWQRFQEEQEFIEAYDMIKETVADLINSWVENEESCKDSLLNLLDQGIKIEMKKMSRKDLVYQLEYLGEEVEKETARRKERLVQELKKLGKEKGEVRLGSIIVGALISTLFFRYQDKAIKGRPFTLNNTLVDNNRKEKICGKLKISNGKSIDSTMLELVKLLHLGNHVTNNWFFREVLAKVVNENLDKLKAVCAAICKEPMEELLKGEEIHENVTHVLQFFGVEKDFLLEKSIPGNSDDALVRNSQSVVGTVSNRSEKSISSSSQQSSADHDPQSSTVPISQGGKSIPSAASKKSCSASNLPSSRVAEKNNEGVMQNNCVQGGNPCYSINTGREFYYLNVRNSSMGIRMEKSQQGGVLNKIRSKQRESLRKKSSDDRLPKVSYLEDAHCERYRKAFLNKVFNYNKFIDSSMLSVEGQNTEMDRSSLNNSSSTSLDISSVSINDSRDESREDDPYLDGMQDYITGLDLLKEGDESRAKNKIRESAVKGFECGMYAYAIIKFKEAMEGNITTNMLGVNCAPQEVVKEAVECMVKSGRSFSPLNSFILGIMELYNVGNYCKVIQHTSQKS